MFHQGFYELNECENGMLIDPYTGSTAKETKKIICHLRRDMLAQRCSKEKLNKCLRYFEKR